MADKLPVSVTIILPTRNEEEALGLTVDSIPRGWCDNLEIMIVDGNSTDRTREIALEKGIRVHLEPRKGYGRAYRTGFVVAKGDIIVTSAIAGYGMVDNNPTVGTVIGKAVGKKEDDGKGIVEVVVGRV